MVSWVRPETAEIPAKPVKVLLGDPVKVISAEIPMWGAPALLSNTMSPPSVHVGEHAAFNVGVIVPDTSKVVTLARAGAPLCPSPAAASASMPAHSNFAVFMTPPVGLMQFYKASREVVKSIHLS